MKKTARRLQRKQGKIRQALGGLKQIGFVRLGLTLGLGLIGAWFMFALAISGVARVKNPELALRFMPNESTALASRADQLLLSNPEKLSKNARALAVAALRQQAVNPKALRILGYYASSQSDDAGAKPFIGLAAKLSRREPGAQIWLIESSVREGDIPKTLSHYDIVLRTKPDLQPALFPQLTESLIYPEIRQALKPYIRMKGGWAEAFLLYANSNSKNLPVIVDLVSETGGLPDLRAAKTHTLDLMARLVSKKQFADVRRLYLMMPGANKSRLTDAAFDSSDQSGSYGSVGWQMSGYSDAGGEFIANGKGKAPALTVFANPATTRIVASKLLFLQPGSYRFDATLKSIESGQGGLVRWQIRCPATESGGAIWTVDNARGAVASRLNIPANCGTQILDIIVSGGQGQVGTEAVIASVSIGQTR